MPDEQFSSSGSRKGKVGGPELGDTEAGALASFAQPAFGVVSPKISIGKNGKPIKQVAPRFALITIVILKVEDVLLGYVVANCFQANIRTLPLADSRNMNCKDRTRARRCCIHLESKCLKKAQLS